MVVAENLGVRFGNRWIFRGLTFEVLKGHRLALLGKNGSGKSTLIRTLAGLQRPSAGTVKLTEGDARHMVGYAALEMSLYPELTVDEHLSLIAKFRACEPRVDELLELVNLKYARSFQAQTLSTGMKLRLKLALALQPNPPLLLLDEPSASLDQDGRDLLARICREQTQNGCLIIATNDPLERRLATHELALE